MIPGEYLLDGPPIELNVGRPTCPVEVKNTGDRPIQVGAHFHFFEVNRALVFDREAAYGMRLDLPAGTAVRFEPGEVKRVQLVALGGQRRVFGGNALRLGPSRRRREPPGERQTPAGRGIRRHGRAIEAGGGTKPAPQPAKSPKQKSRPKKKKK